MRIDLPGIRIEKSDDGPAFLIEERYGFIYLLSKTGYELVKQLIENDCSQEELLQYLKQAFSIDKDNIDLQTDLSDFLQMLREYDLIL